MCIKIIVTATDQIGLCLSENLLDLMIKRSSIVISVSTIAFALFLVFICDYSFVSYRFYLKRSTAVSFCFVFFVI